MKIYILEGHWGLDMSEVIGVYSSREKAAAARDFGKIGFRYDCFCILEAELDKPFAECDGEADWD